MIDAHPQNFSTGGGEREGGWGKLGSHLKLNIAIIIYFMIYFLAVLPKFLPCNKRDPVGAIANCMYAMVLDVRCKFQTGRGYFWAKCRQSHHRLGWDCGSIHHGHYPVCCDYACPY